MTEIEFPVIELKNWDTRIDGRQKKCYWMH